jgi:hypothetical protein
MFPYSGCLLVASLAFHYLMKSHASHVLWALTDVGVLVRQLFWYVVHSVL